MFNLQHNGINKKSLKCNQNLISGDTKLLSFKLSETRFKMYLLRSFTVSPKYLAVANFDCLRKKSFYLERKGKQ